MILPALERTLFGWMQLAIPLVSFCVFARYGEYTGKRFILTAAGLAALVFLLLGRFESILVYGILLLTGYILHLSAQRHESVSRSGLKAALAMSLGWGGVLWLFSLAASVSPYASLLQSFEVGINEALLYYRASDAVSAEAMVVIEKIFHQMLMVVPLIMPAMLGSVVLFTIWVTMVSGNTVLQRLMGTMPWPPYRLWQLPDNLIWLFIAVTVMALLPLGGLQIIALNGLLLLAMIYCFQGLAIAVFYMDKWKMPIFIRAFFYVFLILQSFGTAIFFLLGLIDIWLDLRRLKKKPQEDIE